MEATVEEEKGSLSVHTEKLFPIIKKWLYEERDIFLRELISNAHDAIYKLDRLSDIGEYKGEVGEGRIQVVIDQKAKTLTISDNGLGMTGEEVKKYINQIAFSGAEEFLKKYEQGGKEQAIIGHFGLGFFSAFMVAEEIEIITRSHQFGEAGEDKGAVHWKCVGTTDFTLAPGSRAEIGTDIILHLSDDSKELLDEEKIKGLITRYSDFLPVIIELNGKQVNHQKPLWQRPSSELKDEDYMEFYKRLFPNQEDPLFYVHISVDFPFQVKGILYFPRIRVDMDVTKTGRIKLFCNNVFVSDNIVDIIPQYLNMLQGVLDSPDIPLNVSRSALQSDARVKKLSTHIIKKLADKLVSLAEKDRDSYEKYWHDIHPFVKFAAMNDGDFYDRAKDAVLFTTLGGGTSAEPKPEPTASKTSTDKSKSAASDGDKSASADEEKSKSSEDSKSKESAEAKTDAESKVLDKSTADASDKAGESASDDETAKDPSDSTTASTLISLSGYQKKNSKLKDKILYASDKENEHRAIADIQALGVEVLLMNSPIDPHFIQYLEGKLSPLQFLRVDSAPASDLVSGTDGKDEKSLDEEGEKNYISLFKEATGMAKGEDAGSMGGQEVELRNLPAETGPAMLVVNEHMRRFQEMSSMMSGGPRGEMPPLMGMTLLLNRSHPLVERTRTWLRKQTAGKRDEAAFKKSIQPTLQNIYDLALLRSGKLKGEALDRFSERVTELIQNEKPNGS